MAEREAGCWGEIKKKTENNGVEGASSRIAMKEKAICFMFSRPLCKDWLD